MSAKDIPLEPFEGNLQSMPQDVLEGIFSYLDYAQVSEMGRECRSFREAARSILYRAINKIMLRIENEVTKIEEISKSQLESPNNSAYEQIHFAALLTILKMCSSELQIVSVCCGRYMRDREFDFCFPAGDLLDDFDAIVKTVRCQTGEPDKRVDSDVTTSLFIKTGKFLDFFDATLEMVVEREVPLGLTLLDILGSSQASDFMVELTHAEGRACHQLTGRYELRDTGTVDRPPDLADYPLPVQAKVLVRYLRNYVRWNNLFDSLHKLWDLEKETRDENNNVADKSEDAAHFFEDLAKKGTGYTRKHISDTDDICRDIFQESNSTLESPLGITIEFNLCSRDLPMSLEALKGSHIKDTVSAQMSEKDSKDACIQTELSYVEVKPVGEEVYKNTVDLTEEVDPDKVLDYVQSVKESLHNVRDAVDQLTLPHGRPITAGLDSDRYYSSSDSLHDDKRSPFYHNVAADSTISFPYQCSAVSINGDYSTMPAITSRVGQFRDDNPSHMSVVYHCSIQSLPRDTMFTPNFILSSRNDYMLASSFGRLVSDCSSKKSSSATRLLAHRGNIKMLKQMVRPSTVSGLVEKCKLLEKLSERCISLANSIGSDENVKVDEDEETVLRKLLPRGVEQTNTAETDSEDALLKEMCGNDGSTTESRSFLRRQEVIPEFVDGEHFLMQLKIHYMAEEQKVCEKIVKVDCTGPDIAIDVS